ncbi:MAG: hypothetical protein AB1696_03585 [Planctomycetota bacterium]
MGTRIETNLRVEELESRTVPAPFSGVLPPWMGGPDWIDLNAGDCWTEMGKGSATGGGISDTPTKSVEPAMAIGPDGKPVVAWQEYDIGTFCYQIYVRRWDGASWVEMGSGSASGDGISNNSKTDAASPCIAIGRDGNPIVAWHDGSLWEKGDPSSTEEIYVRRWDGAEWVEMGVESASGGGISKNEWQSLYPSIALDHDDNPIVAWQDQYNTGNGLINQIYVRRWDGEAWVEVGANSCRESGISNTVDPSRHPAITVAGDGNPVVTWEKVQPNANNLPDIYVRKWDGNAWAEMGVHSASGGGLSCSKAWSAEPTITTGADGNPIIAWTENAKIYLTRWDGWGWTDMGKDSAKYYGVSGRCGGTHPSLATSPGGNVFLAWEGWDGNDSEILVRGWNGSAWVEWGKGSAVGGGISNDQPCSWMPSIAVGHDERPVVTWWNNPQGMGEIYIRKYLPSIKLSKDNSAFMFSDSDGDLVKLIYSGLGKADVQWKNGGGVPNADDEITSIEITNSAQNSMLTIRDMNPGVGGDTLNVGHIFATGGSFGAIMLAEPRGAVKADISIDLDLAMLTIQGAADGLMVKVGGNLTNATFNGDFAGGRLAVSGNVSNLRFGKSISNSFVCVGGNAAMITALHGQTNSLFAIQGNATTMLLSGGLSGSLLNVNGDLRQCLINGPIGNNSFVHVTGNTALFRAIGGVKGNSTLALGGNVGSVQILGGESQGIEAGSSVTLGSLQKVALVTGGLAGTFDVTGSAERASICISGDLTGSLLAGVFGNVNINGRLVGQIGGSNTMPGANNMLKVSKPGGGGAYAQNAFAKCIGC